MRSGTWAVVLAAGDGTRLSALTTDARGDVVPKQFCSLCGGQALLQRALERAAAIAPWKRVCAIVARQHARHWKNLLGLLKPGNLIVQPRNCGTAIGVLLCTLRILERDAHARIVFLPADHYVHDEALLADAVRAAERVLTRAPGRVTLVGIAPDGVDSELGYIVPGQWAGYGTRAIAQFVEKPAAPAARTLIARGAVWNSFIFGAYAPSLIALTRDRLPQIVRGMTDALAQGPPHGQRAPALDALYECLPSVDFSRAIVQGAEPAFGLITAPACGWADLGTPQRVARTLQRFQLAAGPARCVSVLLASSAINLSARVARSVPD
jgi:mannose-1-phosphate guanylyltransferase